MAEFQAPPIIIKHIKRGSAGHHGGAWKVAYADFVTAMMAFFLLLWLLSVATPQQKIGIAEYFTPTMGLRDFLGIGFQGGQRAASEIGHTQDNKSMPAIVIGQIKQGPDKAAPDVVQPDVADPNAENTSTKKKFSKDTQDNQSVQDKASTELFQTIAQEIKQSLEQNKDIKDFKDDVVVDVLPDGVKIELVDDSKNPMFAPDSATLTKTGKGVLSVIASIIVQSDNAVAISGHVNDAPNSDPHYTSWELSTDRANAVRRFLVSARLEPERIARVLGFANRDPLMPMDPTSPRNQRVTILLMSEHFLRTPVSGPTSTRGLLSVPDVGTKPEPVVQNEPAVKKSSLFTP